MKNTIVLILCALSFNSLFAQNQEGNDGGFYLDIMLMTKEAINAKITISDHGEENKASLFLVGTDCPPHQQNKAINVSDTYYYQQLRDYANQIDLTTFEPSSEDDADLQVKIIFKDHANGIANDMYFGYNPDNFSELNVFFEYLLQTIDSNVNRICDRDFYEKVKGYLEGEE